jgi:DNA-binding response OmpR family regulator
MEFLMGKDYTITLDDDPMVGKIIEQMTRMRSLAFFSSDALLKKAERLSPKAVFIDIGLSVDDSGLDAIPKVRQLWPFSPILVITGSPDCGLIGPALAAGAHDFVRKPLEAGELTARLNARVAEMRQRESIQTTQIGNAIYNQELRVLQKGDRRAYLSPMAGKVFEILMTAKGQVVRRETLMRGAWGHVKVTENSLDRRIHELRKAIKEIEGPIEIRSLYGKGLALYEK